MKILIVTPKYYPDTFPISLIAERLVKEGNEVHVLTSIPFDNGKYIDEYNKSVSIENGVTVYRVKAVIRNSSTISLVRNYLSIGRKLKAWIKRTNNNYDLVYTYGVSPVLTLKAGNYYQKKYHVRHIAHILDLWPSSAVDAGFIKEGTLSYRILLKKCRKLYQEPHTLLVGSKAFKEYLTNVIKISNNNIVYLPQPGLVSEDKEVENPYDTNKTNILYCGNISKRQLLDYIIPGMKDLNDENIIFNIVGTGAYLDELKEQIKEYGKGNIIYHGYHDYHDSYKYFKWSDAIFVPLKNKGFTGKTIPNKLISALYYSKPIIGMIDGEGKEILTRNGNIIVEESISGLVNGIKNYQSLSKEEKESIIKKNRQLYDDEFSIDKFIEKLLSTFSSK